MNGWKYVLLIAVNVALMFVLMTLPHDKWIEKTLQVLIVIVTFTIFRMFMRERGLMGGKKEGHK